MTLAERKPDLIDRIADMNEASFAAPEDDARAAPQPETAEDPLERLQRLFIKHAVDAPDFRFDREEIYER